MRRPTKMQKLIIHDLLFNYFGVFSAVVGEREAMNCLEQDASKTTSGDLTAA